MGMNECAAGFETALPASTPVQRPQIEAIYRENYQFVWRCLRRLGVHPNSVDDAVQDVFLVAHRKLTESAERTSLRGWLFAIASRVAKEHRRRDGRLCLDERVADSARVHPDKTLELRGRVRQLDELLATLSDPQREVFVMAEVEGFSAPEIAEGLGIHLNTVYSRLRLARQRFERALQRQRQRSEPVR